MASGLLDLGADSSQSSYTETTPDDHLPDYTIAASGPRVNLTTDQTLRPELRQRLDRWGNVLTINDARSLQWITHNRYNRFNQRIEQIQPEVALATGGSTRPTTRFQYDLLGRQIASIDANGNRNQLRYDAAGQLVQELHADVIIATEGRSDVFKSGTSQRQYDVNGDLTGITDRTKRANNRTYVNDVLGQALQVRQGSHIARQLIARGEVLGRYGDMLDPADPKNDDGDPQFTTVSDLNFTYQPINPTHPGTVPTSWKVQHGDTLQTIARQVYGDSAYWYRIADANGITGRDALQPNQALTLPPLANTTYNRADSMRPYEASVLIGDTTPNLPPPDKGGCGILQILVIVIAVVATVASAGAAAGLMGAVSTATGATGVMSLGAAAMTGGTLLGAASAAGAAGAVLGAGIGIASAAIGAVVGSIVSQGVAMALGIQDRFSWKSVALSAVSAGVGSAIGAAASAAGSWLSGATLAPTVARAAIANAATQGIGIVTGFQEQFSWRGVAASGIGAGVGNAVAQGLQGTAFADAFGKVGIATAAGFTGGLAAAVARGGRISVQQVAMDAFGNALGESIVEANWGNTTPDRATARANFRRMEIEAMNEDARIANALALSGSGISEEAYWNKPVRTVADWYADTYGGTATRTGSTVVAASSPYGEGWTDANGTNWLPEVIVTTNRDDGTYGIGNDAYGIRRSPGMPENSPLQVMGESPDGGLIWNTNAVSYPVRASEIDMRSLADDLHSGTGLKLSESDWQSDFMRGYRGEYRSVMEGPAPTAETIGRYSGEVVDSFRNFGLSATGAGSMNAAIASWKAGNYGTSALQTAQAFGEAGLTVFGFGTGSTLRYGATMTPAEWAAARQTYAVERMQFSGGLPVLEGSAYSPGLVNARSMEFYKSYGQNPLHGTMQNLEARQWYLAEDAKILRTVDQSAPMEMQARQAFDLRNANRLQTRDMMADRITADRLMREEPNMTWEKMIQSRTARGLSGEDVYRSILNSSQKTRSSVNKQYGLEQ